LKDKLNREENYRVHALAVNDRGERIENLLCKIYLPEAYHERIWLIISPPNDLTGDKLALLEPFLQFSLTSDSSSGLVVSARNVYTHNISTRAPGTSIEQTEWRAQATDLLIRRSIPNAKAQTECRFWISPSRVLAPGSLTTTSFDGTVTRRPAREVAYDLTNGLTLNFQTHYKYSETPEGDTLTKSHLVAVSTLWGEPDASERIDSKLLREVDDFLSVVSLATRHRCVCVGWDASDTVGVSEFYRGDISFPPNVDEDFNSYLVDRSQCALFIRTVYDAFTQDEFQHLLRYAIHSVLPREQLTMEARFVSLFSGIETLLLAFRRRHGLEFIYSSAEDKANWDETKTELRKWLKSTPWLAGVEKAAKRKLIYENLPALERISFNHALEEFCKTYDLDLHDLWDIKGGGESFWSLTTIRNKLVHGEPLPNFKASALDTAIRHVQWTLERMILAYFGWEISESNVCGVALSQFYRAHRNVENPRRIMSS
jgi:hypothetical protein